jgi:acetolactate synthase-1/2/3 large subunit
LTATDPTVAGAADRSPAPLRWQGHGGRLAAKALRARGVEAVFTLSGGHLFSFYDGCVNEGIRLIDVRHEQSAVFAAEAWSKVSRRTGVAAVTAGPGVTNAVSALATAQAAGAPLLVLGGRAPQARWGQGSLQELDHVPIVASVTKRAETCQAAADVAETVASCLASAGHPHRGPVFLDLPLDVAFGFAEVDPVAGEEPAASRGAEVDPEDLRRVGALLARAERPILVAGSDIYWEHAENELRLLAEACAVPVLTNGLGRGCLAADHARAFSRARSVAMREADLVVVAGTPLDFRLGFGRFAAPAVHLMDRPERLATHVALAASAAGDLRAVLSGVREACLASALTDHGPWLERLRSAEVVARSEEEARLTSDAAPIHPARIYGELRRRLARDAIVVGDGGDFVSYAGKLVDTFVPGCFLDPGPYGCLGTGPGYALGAKMAFPHRQVVLLSGDGAAGFSLGDLDTLTRFGHSVVVVVGNNRCWGLEKHPMQQLYGYHVAAELSGAVRYDRVAEALGAAGELVEVASQIGPALDRALAHRGSPYLLDVRTDPEDQYPRSSNLA